MEMEKCPACNRLLLENKGDDKSCACGFFSKNNNETVGFDFTEKKNKEDGDVRRPF
jgi:hypothetical protein